MADPFISSDPNAWLRPYWQRPYWQRLHQQQSFFANLAPELQAKALVEALAEDHPNEAAEIREWNAATRRAMTAVLDQAIKERLADRQTELWRMTKGSREVTCVAVYNRVGLDLRLLERGEMLRTELFQGGLSLQAQSRQWREALNGTGWRELR